MKCSSPRRPSAPCERPAYARLPMRLRSNEPGSQRGRCKLHERGTLPLSSARSRTGRRPGRDDRRRPRVLLRVLDRTAPGHHSRDRGLDRRRRSRLRPAELAAHCAVRQIHCGDPAGGDAQLANSATARSGDRQRRHAAARRDDRVRGAGSCARSRSGVARELAPKGVRGWIRARILSFGLILAVGFLLLVSLSISTALAALRAAIGRRFTELVVLAGVLDFVISTALVTGLIALIYRYLPARRTGMASDPVGRARHGAPVPPRAMGDRVVPRPLDSALGVRRCGFVRGDAAVAVLLRADLPARSRVHGLPRRRPRCATETKGGEPCDDETSICWSSASSSLVLVAVRLALEPILLDYANDKLDGAEGVRRPHR